MSDDEFMMDDALEEEDYGFEYEDDDDEHEGDADVENKYYNAKAMKSNDPLTALRELQNIVDQVTPQTEWGFKALKQQCKIFLQLGRFSDALGKYERVLHYTHSVVTRNYAEKSICSILDRVSAATSMPLEHVEAWFSQTQNTLCVFQADRLHTKIGLKLARLWLARREWDRLARVLDDLRTHLMEASHGDIQSQGTTVLELLSLEIQMYQETGNLRMVKATYNAAMNVQNAIPHPRTMGVIREFGGKMHMTEKNWEAAQVDFFQAFRNYDEAGSPQRIQVLKYLVMANMLMGSGINVFDSQETKPYKDDPNIVAMTALADAFERRDVDDTERIVADYRDSLASDSFVEEFLVDVLRELRVQYILDYVRPYAAVRMDKLASLLHLHTHDVESLLVMLILDGRLDARIDGVEQVLKLPRSSISHAHDDTRQALYAWYDQMWELAMAISSKQANRLARAT